MRKNIFLLAWLPLALAACNVYDAERLQAVQAMEAAATRTSELRARIDHTDRALEELGTQLKQLREDIKAYGAAYESTGYTLFSNQVEQLSAQEAVLLNRLSVLEHKRSEAVALVEPHRNPAPSLQARAEERGCGRPTCI